MSNVSKLIFFIYINQMWNKHKLKMIIVLIKFFKILN